MSSHLLLLIINCKRLPTHNRLRTSHTLMLMEMLRSMSSSTGSEILNGGNFDGVDEHR